MTKNVTVKMLRPRLPEILDKIDSRMDRFIVTRRGRPVAVMMSVDDYESLLETYDVLADARLVRKVRAAIADIKKGNTKTLEDVEREIGLV